MKNLFAAVVLGAFLIFAPAVGAEFGEPYDVRLVWELVPGATGYAAEVVPMSGAPKIVPLVQRVAYEPGTGLAYVRLDAAALIRIYALSTEAPFTCASFSAPSNAILVQPPICYPSNCKRLLGIP